MNNNGDTCSNCWFNKLESDVERCNECTKDLFEYRKWKSIPASNKPNYVLDFDEGGVYDKNNK